MKRILNRYIQNNVPRKNTVPYKKKDFQPFVDERDHLGNLIDSDVRTELGGMNYIKKLVVIKPLGNKSKIEVRDDIPRRWLENVKSQDSGIA